MSAILVFGSTSYLGSETVKSLLRAGHTVYVFVRGSTRSFLLGEALGDVRIVDAESVLQLSGVDAIINFGFVKDYSDYHDALEKTGRQIDQIITIVGRLHPRAVIHISSQAVFGDAAHFPAERRRSMTGDEYADSKLLAENMLREGLHQSDVSLSIVRLGNVMGEWAPNWTGSIVSRILNLSTFAYEDSWGYSNVSYVHNISSYIEHLLNTDKRTLANFGLFHHLAEFSSIGWDKWVLPMSESLGVPSHYLYIGKGQADRQSPGTKPILRNRILRSSFVKAAGKVALERMSYFKLFRDGINELKQRLPYDIRMDNLIDAADSNFCNIISTRNEFLSKTLPGWSPPFSFQTALDRILVTLDDK